MLMKPFKLIIMIKICFYLFDLLFFWVMFGDSIVFFLLLKEMNSFLFSKDVLN